MRLRNLFGIGALATVALASAALAQSALQWNYAFVNGVSTATYPANVRFAQSTVALLPTCNAAAVGSIRQITDATTPAYNATAVGGGAVFANVMCNGTNWVTQ